MALLSHRGGVLPALPWRFVLPNLVTLAALGFGVSGLMLAADDAFTSAAACILIAAVLDACDGRVARATGGASRFGAELDSLADIVCFGAAPALLLHRAFLHEAGLAGAAAALAFPMASALRLARFNVAQESPRPSWARLFFDGVPAPGGAFLALTPLFAVNAGLLDKGAVPLALLLTPLVALLMVSTWPTFSSKTITRRALRLYFLPSFLGAVAGVLGLAFWSWAVLSLASVIYLASLPFSLALRARLAKAP